MRPESFSADGKERHSEKVSSATSISLLYNFVWSLEWRCRRPTSTLSAFLYHHHIVLLLLTPLILWQVLDVGCGIGGPLREIARFRSNLISCWARAFFAPAAQKAKRGPQHKFVRFRGGARFFFRKISLGFLKERNNTSKIFIRVKISEHQ